MQNGSDEARESVVHSGWTVESRTPQPVPHKDPAAAKPGAGVPGAPERGADAFNVGDDQHTLRDYATSPDAHTQAVGTAAQMSNLTVVMLGVTGGLFLLYAWVWMSWAQYYSDINAAVAAGSGSIGGVLQQIIFWITPLAPVLWFIAAFTLYRKRARRLALAVVIGLIVTFPLPMVFMNGAAL